MDPLTAALQLANTIAQIVLVAIESQPSDVRAAYADRRLKDFDAWRGFVQQFAPKP